ncbi:hypothetical protein T190611E02C_11123 [Tenacibaculum sp. 190524A05c]|uniref:hypothetical protein n=1 Tax=Tenacibaculum platacis TaxID=3137852 RepID=UPI0031FAE182
MKKLFFGTITLIFIGVLAFFFYPQLYFSTGFGQKIMMKVMGEQTATFEFKSSSKDSLYMSGVIYANTLDDLKEVLDQNPEVKTLVMMEVPGSIDDHVNLLASREIRKRNINTFIPKGGMVASGGTDMFLAGTKRNADSTAEIGVHSWSDGEKEGIEYPREDEVHKMYLEYYKEMEIPTEFYWYTLEAAAADSIHNMTQEEIQKYKILNK